MSLFRIIIVMFCRIILFVKKKIKIDFCVFSRKYKKKNIGVSLESAVQFFIKPIFCVYPCMSYCIICQDNNRCMKNLLFCCKVYRSVTFRVFLVDGDIQSSTQSRNWDVVMIQIIENSRKFFLFVDTEIGVA